MAAQIKNLASSVNNQSIGNILDNSDDTYWMSNGSQKPIVSMDLDGHIMAVFLDFQRGFQPRAIKVIERASVGVFESMIKVMRTDSKVKIHVRGAETCHIDIVFEESYDPYGRICIYSLDARESDADN